VKNIEVDFLTQRDRAAFAVWAICDENRIPEVKEAICAELRRLAAEPSSPRELATAKRLIYAGYAFANETPSDRAATLAFYEAIDSYRAGTRYLARINALTSADIMKVASWFAGAPVWIVLRPYGGVP